MYSPHVAFFSSNLGLDIFVPKKFSETHPKRPQNSQVKSPNLGVFLGNRPDQNPEVREKNRWMMQALENRVRSGGVFFGFYKSVQVDRIGLLIFVVYVIS